MSKRLEVVHVIANCRDCDWTTEDYVTGRVAAYRHAKSRKHRVLVEVAYGGLYDGRTK